MRANLTFFDHQKGFGFANTSAGARLYFTHRDLNDPAADLPLLQSRITLRQKLTLDGPARLRATRARNVVAVRE